MTTHKSSDEQIWNAWRQAGNTNVHTGDILRGDIVAFGRAILAAENQDAARYREALQGLVDLRGHGSWGGKWIAAWDAAFAALAPASPHKESQNDRS